MKEAESWLPGEFRLQLGRFGLEYDSDYGAAHRSGWTVLWHGSHLAQLTTLRACAWAFYKAERA